jgi:alpha/beta superfamily hydrolase
VSDSPPTLAQELGVLAVQDVAVADDLAHLELYTVGGLLSVLWHGPRDAEGVLLCCGGAMGSLLGPANGLYQDLGATLATQGIGTLRVGYRQPNDLEACTVDLLVAAAMARDRGATRYVTMGHSFGGAVAIQAAVALGQRLAGVVTLATQAGGCEGGEVIEGTPMLLFHGDRDAILPKEASVMVQYLTGGELVVLPGADHLLVEAATPIRERLSTWLPERLAPSA